MFEDINQKTHKNKENLVVDARSAMCHESPRTQPKLGKECGMKKKQDLTSMAVPQNKTVAVIVDKLHRKEVIRITALINLKKARNQLRKLRFQLRRKQKTPVCNHFRQNGDTG